MKHINLFKVYKGLTTELYILFISRVITCIGGFIFPLLTLIATQKIGLTQTQTGIFITIYTASHAPFTILGGKLADKFNSKYMIVIFSTLGALMYVVCAFLQPSLFMGILLIIAADLYVVTYPAFNKIIAQVSEKRDLKKAYSLMYMGYNVGFAVGPMLGALLFTNHLSLMFTIDAATTFISVLLIVLFVKSSSFREDEIEEEVSINVSIFPFLRANIGLLIFSFLILIYNMTYNQWYFMLPMQLADLFFENGVRLFSILVSFNAIIVVIFTPLLTNLTNKMHVLTTIVFGGFLYAGASLIFAINGSFAYFFLAVYVLTIGEVLIAVYSNTYIASKTPLCYLGRMNSLFYLISGSGEAITPIVTGYLLLSFSYTAVWDIFSIFAFFGAIGMLSLLYREKKKGISLQ